MGVINDINVDILRNRGIMVKVHRLKKDDEGNYVKPYVRERDEQTGEYITEPAYIKFTNWTLANLDDDPPTGFGGLEEFQGALEERPMKTVPATIAHVYDMYDLNGDGDRIPDVRFGASLLMDDSIHEYLIVCLNAMLMAQGVASPELVAETVKAQVTALREGRLEAETDMRTRLKEIAEEVASSASTGDTQIAHEKSQQSSASTPDGALSGEVMTSSGT